ncbi:UvrD-helicase domain-containing protein [Leucobacter sp. Z1108]|uniref:UvrD-helicase domain-containing protein n=1 Tax=Leucobacter sp. Z1108 TaxID=3439066 RepID=UPI003F2EB95C
MTRRIDSPDTDADIKLRDVLARPTATCFVMNAGAGSGKTTSLVKALAHLRDTNGENLRKNGQQVACITYTEVAAGEIHGEIEEDPLFHVSTIHSFLWTVIKPFKRDVSTWVTQRIEEKIAGLQEHNAKPRTQAKTIAKNTLEIERLETNKAAMTTVTAFTYGVGSRYDKGILGHDDVIKMVPQLILEKPLLRKLIAKRYPFIFVDESQDTFPQVVAALKELSNDLSCELCIGFFGDPMQQIYATGAGDITLEPGWEQIDKPENFRCPAAVLSVINNIRREVPGALLQEGGRRLRKGDSDEYVQGEAHLFVLPIDEERDSHLARVREWLATNTHDPEWSEDHSSSDVRILVIEHRLAARRLGFENLFSSHHDKSTDILKTGIAEGTAWTTHPFVTYLTPLAQSVWTRQKFPQIQLVRANSPLILGMSTSQNPSSALKSLSAAAESVAEMLQPDSSATVRTVLQHATATGLLLLDERFKEYESLITNASGISDLPDQTNSNRQESGAIARYLDVPARELVPYQSYLNEHSVYATHQGVKGAEFGRVIVLLEDDAAAGNMFSYNKLLGLQDLSDKDRENIAAGLESTIDRTRRLLYVGCSRAERALAVVIFARDVSTSARQLRELNIFDSDCVHDATDLHRTHTA